MDGNAPVTPVATPDWRTILEAAVKNHERGKAGVADRLGVGRSYVSQILSTGKSARPAPPKFVERVIASFHTVNCPYTGWETPYADCAKANGPVPTFNPLLVQRWRACQGCPNKPAKESKQ